MNKIIVAGVLSAMIASPVMANGFYIGLEGGTFKSDLSAKHKKRYKDSGAVYSLYVGKPINDNMAVEVGYSAVASGKKKAKVSSLTFESHYESNVLSLDVIGKTSNKVGGYALGSLGGAYSSWSKKVKNIETGRAFRWLDEPNSGSKMSLRWGVGVGYKFSESSDLRLMYRGYDLTDKIKVRAATIGYVHSFGFKKGK